MAITGNSKRKLTYAEYCQIPEDGRRHEIIDGDHYVSPAPYTYHQTLSRRIQFQLYSQIEEKGLGLVFNAPTDLQLSQVDIVQPDLIIVFEAHRNIVTPTKIKGVPDLVVEILSKSTSERDRGIKLALYQRSRVPEYWVVDPDEHTIEPHVLEGETYRSAGLHTTTVTVRGIDGVQVDLTKVW
jgi:Uma2 family endonuclease